MKKRAAAMLLTFILFTLCIISGCGAPEESGSGDVHYEDYIGVTLNILVMPVYEDEQIIKPFEEKYGVKVNSRIYPSSDQMFSILSNASRVNGMSLLRIRPASKSWRPI